MSYFGTEEQKFINGEREITLICNCSRTKISTRHQRPAKASDAKSVEGHRAQ